LNKVILNLLDGILKNGEEVLFGFTSKFEQWIPAMVIAKILKQNHPNVKTIIGGFGDRKSALALMKMSSHFDFAVWGEGEYVLLELCNQITSDRNFSRVPRIVYKEDNELIVSDMSKSKFISLEQQRPDFSDFFQQNKFVTVDCLPIEGSRSCHWKKCSFCYLNQGYKYRRKEIDNLVNEIIYFIEKYPDLGFLFTDNDIIGDDITTFENFLDKLIEYNSKHEKSVIINLAEVIPQNLSKRIIKKMTLAGFRKIQVGYESTSDSILRKMRKKSSFSDLILVFKFTQFYGIGLNGLNIIRNLIDEPEEDILEGIENIKFLRFYLNNNYYHHIINLAICSNSKYYKHIDKNEIKKWKINRTYFLTPSNLWRNINKFDLLEFISPVEHADLWDLFTEINDHYTQNSFTYRLFRNGAVFFEEYQNNELLSQIEFNKEVYWEILVIANDKVCSFDEIIKSLSHKGYKCSDTEIYEILEELKSEYILYYDSDYSKIISIINTDLIITVD